MGNTSPGGGTAEGWAEQGFTEVTPADPSANQGDSDTFENDREQLAPKDRYPRIEDAQRGDIKPLKSKYVP